MAEPRNGLKNRLEDQLGASELKAREAQLRQETGGLLDDGALRAMIADELGLLETPFTPLAELDPAHPVFTRCMIEAIEPPFEFKGKDRAGRLRKLKVTDKTGSLTLTLWDEETAIVEQLGIRPGSFVRILSATLRETRYGREIHVGRTGFVIPEEPPAGDGKSEPRNLHELGQARGRVDVKGVILAINTIGRGRQKITSIKLFDGTGECALTIPHALLLPPPGLVQGAEIELSGARVVRREGQLSLECDKSSRLQTI